VLPSRRMRRSVATGLECVALLAAIILGGKGGLILLLAAGSIVLFLRDDRWFPPRPADDGTGATLAAAAGGTVVGIAALALAWWLGPASVEWTTEPVVRGSAAIAGQVMLVTLVLAVAAELVFRRWLVDRIAALVLARGEPRAVALAAGVLIAATIEAAVSPAGGGSRVGTLVGGLGLGAIYVTSGGRLAACLTARAAFDLGALLLQALRVTA
jgi:hypothetical protein